MFFQVLCFFVIQILNLDLRVKLFSIFFTFFFSPLLSSISLIFLLFSLILLSFASNLLSCCYLLIFLCLVLLQIVTSSSYCFILLLPRHLVLLPWLVASSHYLVRYLIALLHHCLVHHFVALSRYLATSPCCLVSYLIALCRCFLPHHAAITHCFIGSLCYLATSKYLLNPPHLLFCCLATLCLTTSLPCCIVLVGTSFLPPILQGGAWSLQKQTFQQPPKKVNIHFLFLFFIFFC